MPSINSLLATLCYSDIFYFPLTKEELYRYFLYEKITHKKLDACIVKNKEYLTYKNGFYALKGREKAISKRIQNKENIACQLRLAKEMAKILSVVPTVQVIGLSGSLAVENSTRQDDIDFFIITSSGFLWLTRLVVIVILFLLGKKKSRLGMSSQNKICVNMFIDSATMSLPVQKRNIYTAHEVVQVNPLVNKNNTYENFLFANKWVQKYFKNMYIKKVLPDPLKNSVHALRFFRMFEYIAKLIQLQYMKPHRTTEMITNNLLAFHPQDKQPYVLQEFKERLKKYGI